MEKTSKEEATHIIVNTWAWKYQWTLEFLSQNSPASPWVQLLVNICGYSLLTDFFVADQNDHYTAGKTSLFETLLRNLCILVQVFFVYCQMELVFLAFFFFLFLHFGLNFTLHCISQPFGRYSKSKPSFLTFYWKVDGAVS